MKCCIRLATGIYNCQWKETNNPSAKLGENFWWWFLFLVFLISVSWLFCWSVFSNDYFDFEWFVYQQTGIVFGWSVLILTVFIICTFYTTLLFFAGVTLIATNKARHLYTCHKISICIVWLLCSGGYFAIGELWGAEYGTAKLAWQIMGPFIHIVLLICMTASSWLIFREVANIKTRFFKFACIGITFSLMVCICLLPITIHSPCISHEAFSYEKPRLIGHRCGFMEIAPENTMLSFQQAKSHCDVFGVETDVTISWDGVPFLMHDDTLLRTTNVKDIFPNRSESYGDTFLWDELKKLDAGSWFLEDNPFYNVHRLSDDEKSEIRAQKIPTLTDLADKAAENNYSLIFDLRRPHEGHPYRDKYLNLTLQTLLHSKMEQDLVLWLPEVNRSHVHIEAPEFHLVSTHGPIPYLKYYDIRFVNWDYNLIQPQSVESYRASGISVIEYVVSSPWIFSLSWCRGAEFVTTNNCAKLSTIDEPVYTWTPHAYLAIWICCDVIACLIFIAMSLIHLQGNCRSHQNKETRRNNGYQHLMDAEIEML